MRHQYMLTSPTRRGCPVGHTLNSSSTRNLNQDPGTLPFNLLNIYHQYVKLPYPQKLLLKIARKIYLTEKIPIEQKTGLILCSDYYIRKLNRIYRKKTRLPTCSLLKLEIKTFWEKSISLWNEPECRRGGLV